VNQIRTLGVALSGLLVLAACAGVPTRSDFDASATFSELRSFAWLEPSYETVEDPLLDSQLLGAKVYRATVNALTARGYRQVETDQADFLVTYHTTSRERIRDSGVTVGFGISRGSYRRGGRHIFLGHNEWYESYQEGTLILDIIRADDNRLVWRGWMSDRVHRDRFTDEGVERTVRQIIEAFPPQ